MTNSEEAEPPGEPPGGAARGTTLHNPRERMIGDMTSLIDKLCPCRRLATRGLAASSQILGLLFGLLFGLLPGPALATGVVLVFGDSLSSAYGISQKEGWVTLLQERLSKNRLDYTVVNQSIPGETTSGGATRIKAVMAQARPKVTIIALGGNDGLRGLPVKQMRENLAQIVRTAQASGSKVLLAGMKMPPNYGAAYTREFESMFTDLAKQLRTGVVPFLLDGMDTRRDLFQPDDIHPTAEAQPMIVDTVWKRLKPLL
jgi:acyl-CoA thioesterase-1